MLAILAPGQGAQSPGFLRPWLDLPAAADLIHRLLLSAGADDVIELVTAYPELDADEAQRRLRDTRVLQPLLVAVGLSAAELLNEGAPYADVVAGHSLGEVTALTMAGVVDASEGVRLAVSRGASMAAAAARTPTAMLAVTGSDPGAVAEAVDVAVGCGLSVANRNGETQVVLAGPVESVGRVEATPLPRVRAARLDVAGAFHTEHMRPAAEAITTALSDLLPRDPAPPLVSNLDGTVLRSGQEVIRRLPEQLVSCVRWDLCLATMRELRVTGVLELPPAGTLTALARRELPHVERFALDSPTDLPRARQFAERHAG